MESMQARYILLYNTVLTAAWLVVLIRLVRAVVSFTDVYEAVELPLKLAQTAAILEIVHAATGIVRASAATTALQVGSRLQLVWGISHVVAPVRTNTSFTTMVLAWSLTEIPRYFYFAVSAITTAKPPFWLTFLRYSTFLPLYPIGASSEWLTMFAALPFIAADRLFSVQLPNRLNFGFDYHIFCIILLALYIPGLPYMYSHMLRQRRKYVTGPTNTPPNAKGIKAN